MIHNPFVASILSLTLSLVLISGVINSAFICYDEALNYQIFEVLVTDQIPLFQKNEKNFTFRNSVI